MQNQRGGIISNILIVPIGILIMAGIFLAGYYAGWKRAKASAVAEGLPPLPAVISDTMPKPEDFTFYKTLTDTGNKTVSIDVKKQPDMKSPENPVAPSTEEKVIQAKPRKETVLKQAAPVSRGIRYTIQIASYPDKNAAQEEVKKLKKNGFAAFVIAYEPTGKGTWYRVRLGSYANRGAAEKMMKELLAKQGGSAFVTQE